MSAQNVTSIATAPSRTQRLAEAKQRYESAMSDKYAAQRRANQAQMDYDNILEEFSGPLVD